MMKIIYADATLKHIFSDEMSREQIKRNKNNTVSSDICCAGKHTVKI